MSWDKQHIHHQLMMFYEHVSQSATTIPNKVHPVVLALMLWFLCTSATRSVSSDEAVIDDLGCTAYSLSSKSSVPQLDVYPLLLWAI